MEEKNTAFVLEAFDTLFNTRDDGAAERYWSLNDIQRSAHIAPSRDGWVARRRVVSELTPSRSDRGVGPPRVGLHCRG